MTARTGRFGKSCAHNGVTGAPHAASPIIKRGIALTPVKFGISFNATFYNQAGALLHVYKDGSVAINHGGTEMGQGLHTKIIQIVAQELGLPVSMVRITATDTGKVPNTSATAASSGADLNGKAAQAAARTIRARLVAYLCTAFGVTAEQVGFDNGQVQVGERTIAFAEVVQQAYLARVQLSATGYYRTPKIHWDRLNFSGRPFFYFGYGASVSEVAVDSLTGETRLLRVDLLHDAGSSLNPALDRRHLVVDLADLIRVVAAREAGVDKIIVTGLNTPSDQKRLAMAKHLGASHTVAIGDEDLLESVAEITGGLMADLVIDCASGGPASVISAIQLARKKGRVILGGIKRQKVPQFDSDMIIAKFLTVKGMRGHSYESVELALQLIAGNRHNVKDMSTHMFGLDQTEYAIRSLVGEGAEDAIHMTIDPWK